MTKINEEPAPRIGGWLFVLCLFFLVWQPISTAVAASIAFSAIPVRGVSVVLVLVLRVIVTGLGMAAGVSLAGIRPGAVALARAGVVASACTDLFVYLTPYFPNNHPPGTTKYFVVWTLFFYGAWLAYLSRSRRVRDTFS